MSPTATIGVLLQHKGSRVWTVSPEVTVYDAISQMAEKDVGALLVMEGEKLLGLISERDYTRKVILKGKSSKHTAVREIISTHYPFATPVHTIEECMRMMTETRVRHLPVLDGEKLVGIVSIGDLVNWTIHAQHQTIDQLAKYISGQYPG